MVRRSTRCPRRAKYTRPGDLIPTGVAAKAIGVNHATLVRWWQHGLVTPAVITAGGHARRDIEELRQQLRDRRQRDE
jgi:DNA-binding transcriptional MerR regulator